MTLRELIEAVSRKAEDMFAAAGEVRPLYHIEIEGEVFVVPPPPLPIDAALAMLRDIFEKIHPQRIVFMDEAWVVRSGSPEPLAVPSLAQHPDRIEVVVFQGEDVIEGAMTARRNVIREPGQKPTLGPLEFADYAMTGGRLCDLLPRAKGRTH